MQQNLYMLKHVFSLNHERKIAYNFMVYGDKDYAITNEGKLLFFSSPEEAEIVWKKLKLNKLLSLPKEISLICDITKVIHVLKKDYDNKAVILNFINTYDDLLKTINIEIPSRYRKSLYMLADHLTFSREIRAFFSCNKYSINFIGQGLLKLNKLVLSNSVMFDDYPNKLQRSKKKK